MSGSNSAISLGVLALLTSVAVACSDSHCDDRGSDAGRRVDGGVDAGVDGGCNSRVLLGPVMLAAGGRVPGGEGCSTAAPGLEVRVHLFSSGSLRETITATCDDDYIDLGVLPAGEYEIAIESTASAVVAGAVLIQPGPCEGGVEYTPPRCRPIRVSADGCGLVVVPVVLHCDPTVSTACEGP